MYLAFATVADYATVEGGVINIIGARLIVSLVNMPARVHSFAAIFVLAAEAEDYGKTINVGIIGLKPDGTRFMEAPISPIAFTPPDEELGISSMQIVMNAGGLVWEQEGVHRFQLVVEEQIYHEIKFAVVLKGGRI